MSASSDCGCGGSPAAVAVKGGCGCGGSGCGSSCGSEVSLTGEGFVRPRFFGGMLLTEDDLQAAVDYAVAKRKLTNRHVIGAGVVCGLDVTCHPCDSGKVNVSPGYAIECCGNDILVSCPEEVDILSLVRDLRLRTGIDCGEPCDEQPRQEYYLYIRYVEAPTAPVAPYAPDDCATGECEFSRIREGYCFELRCDPPDSVLTLIDALEACQPDDEVVKDDTRTMVGALQIAAKYSDIASNMATGPEPLPPAPTKSEFDALAGDDVNLADGLELVTRATLTLAFDAAAAKGTAPSPRLNASRRALITDRNLELAARLRESPELKAQPPEEHYRIERILTTVESQPDLSALGPIDRAWLAEGTSAHEAERAFVAGAETMRGRVLRELSSRGQTTCDEYRNVSRLRFDRLTTTSKEDAVTLAQAFLRSETACVCSAFNPPCPTCTDDAVVLAKVRVDGCDVIDVCALERRWVLSPTALGYWLPVVEMFRKFMERVCCDGVKFGQDRHDRIGIMRHLGAEGGATVDRAVTTFTAAVGERPEFMDLLEVMGRPMATATASAASAATAAPPADPAAAAAAVAEHAVGSLEAKLEELSKRLDELAAVAKNDEKPAEEEP